MKKTALLILILTAGIWQRANAQYTYKGQCNITLSGGWLVPQGFNVQLGVEKAIKQTYHLMAYKIGYSTNRIKVQGFDDRLKVNYYNAYINYGYSLNKFIPAPVYINLFGGLLIGYEDIPANLQPGVLVNPKSKFIFGMNIAPQIEFGVSSKITLYLEPQLLLPFNSGVGINRSCFQMSGGIKIYL